MIIGNRSNNFNNQSNNFQNKWNNINEHNENRPKPKNIFNKDITEHKYANAANSQAMHDKSLAMLQSRLDNKLITTEEFNKKCAELNKIQENMTKRNKLF